MRSEHLSHELNESGIERFFKIISLLEAGLYKNFSEMIHLFAHHYLAYLKFVLTDQPQEKKYLTVKSFLLTEFNNINHLFPALEHSALLHAVREDILHDGRAIKTIYQEENIDELIDLYAKISSETNALLPNKHPEIPKVTKIKSGLTGPSSPNLIFNLLNNRGSLVIEEEQGATQMQARVLQAKLHLLTICKSRNDGSYERVLKLARQIAYSEVSLQEVITTKEDSVAWYELLNRLQPYDAEKNFAILNNALQFKKTVKTIDEIIRILTIFPRHKNEIYQLIKDHLNFYTHNELDKFFMLAELFTENAHRFVKHFFAPHHFTYYVKGNPLDALKNLLQLFPQESQTIFAYINEDKSKFLYFAGDTAKLAEFVALFPEYKEHIYEKVVSPEYVSNFYHYGQFSKMNCLETLFSNHVKDFKQVLPREKGLEGLHFYR